MYNVIVGQNNSGAVQEQFTGCEAVRRACNVVNSFQAICFYGIINVAKYENMGVSANNIPLDFKVWSSMSTILHKLPFLITPASLNMYVLSFDDSAKLMYALHNTT